MVGKKTAVELFFYGSSAIGGMKFLDLALSPYLGNNKWYYLGLTVILFLVASPIAKKVNGE